ncbi:SRPBCC family protein [Solihabitans fulvus]|uniref:SRPBCC family protein n=1 Tax=Solihabitans fulvus TaxID=1892852 RepID=A0A5B2XML1_9PSEU|nr:SRPBCC family protein [Solihabitans fulvus]KAA2265098.1 SRPBCC family protein [Solihabitans fulvus]
MASIRKDIVVQTDAASVWEAVRDFANVHKVLVPGFVVDCEPVDDERGEARSVTFATGRVARELLVTRDEEARRLVYSVVESQLPIVHYSAAVEVSEGDDGRTRVVWTLDLLPDSLAEPMEMLMSKGAEIMTQTLTSR